MLTKRIITITPIKISLNALIPFTRSTDFTSFVVSISSRYDNMITIQWILKHFISFLVEIQKNVLFISKQPFFSVINVGIFLDTFLHIRYFLILIIAEMCFLLSVCRMHSNVLCFSQITLGTLFLCETRSQLLYLFVVHGGS